MISKPGSLFLITPARNQRRERASRKSSTGSLAQGQRSGLAARVGPDVAEITDTSGRDAIAATKAGSAPLARLCEVARPAWTDLARDAVEPNGYYLPGWALAVDASARGRSHVD